MVSNVYDQGSTVEVRSYHGAIVLIIVLHVLLIGMVSKVSNYFFVRIDHVASGVVDITMVTTATTSLVSTSAVVYSFDPLPLRPSQTW